MQVRREVGNCLPTRTPGTKEALTALVSQVLTNVAYNAARTNLSRFGISAHSSPIEMRAVRPRGSENARTHGWEYGS